MVKRKGIKSTGTYQKCLFFSQMSGRFFSLSVPGSVGQKSQGIFANRAQGLNDQRKRHAIIFIVNCDQFRRRGGGG